MLDRKLHGLWRRQRAFVHLRGSAAVLLTLATLIVAGLAVDWLLALPPVARMLLFLGMLAAVGTVGYRQWWTQLRPFDASRAALQVERHHRELGSSLIAYVQFGRQPDGSVALVTAARDQAVRLAEPLRFDELVVFGELRNRMLMALFAVAVVLAVSVQWPVAMAAFGERLLNPFSDRIYPTRTQLVLLNPDQVVPRSAAVSLAAQVEGVQPADGRLLVRHAGTGEWETIRLSVDEQGQMTHRFSALDRSAEYYFRAGDGRSATGAVRVVPPPRVQRVQVTLEPPDYINLVERELTSLNIRAPEGTQVHWRLEMDHPLVKAELLPLDERGEVTDTAYEMELREDGAVAALSLPVQSWRYRLRWTLRPSESGPLLVFDDLVQHQLQAVPDAPPRVRLIEPARRSQPSTLQGHMPVMFHASDDHGLSDAWIVYRFEDDEAEYRVPAGDLSGQSTGETTFGWRLDETIEGLSVGDRIEFTVEVADNREHSEGRQRARATPWRSVEILSVEAFLQMIAEQQVEAFEQVGQVRDETGESLYEVRRLEEEAAETDQAETEDGDER
ncbi:MAG: hypothetical protein WD534_02800 [Phycisphaeraceae bacterium]